MDWSTLQKNDKLYLLVPITKNDNIYYQFQESYVISHKVNKGIIYIRFKYTDSTNHRRREDFWIYSKDINSSYISISKNMYNHTPKYGHMIVCYDDPHTLNVVYHEMIAKKIDETNNLINDQKQFLNFLENQKFNQIV